MGSGKWELPEPGNFNQFTRELLKKKGEEYLLNSQHKNSTKTATHPIANEVTNGRGSLLRFLEPDVCFRFNKAVCYS